MREILRVVFLVAFVFLFLVGKGQVIYTVAGSNNSGENLNATAISLNSPQGIALDTAGNLYVVETDKNRIRKIDKSGIVTTIAGNGKYGYSGDGGKAINAEMYFPTEITLDRVGNIYVKDPDNYCIRKITPAGIITTVASQLYDPHGLVVDKMGNIYTIASNQIQKITSTGVVTRIVGTGVAGFSGDGSSATLATLNSPNGLAIDTSGNIYISDYGNGRIRKVNNLGIISTVAGNGTLGNSGDGNAATSASLTPYGLATDASGNIYIACTENQCVRKVGTDGIISTIAGNGTYGYTGDGGLATLAAVRYPYNIAVNAVGEICFSDRVNNCIRKIDVNGIINTIAGNGAQDFYGNGVPATSAFLSNGLIAGINDSGEILIADAGNNMIRKVTTSGNIITIAGNGKAAFSGDNGLAINASLNNPTGVVQDNNENVFIADMGNKRIRKIDKAGIITTIAGTGVEGFSGDNGPATAAQIFFTYGNIAIDKHNNIYIAEERNFRIRKIDTFGIINTVAGGGTLAGTTADGGSALNAKLISPLAVAVDSFGNIYIADASDKRIRKVDTLGIITTIAGNGTVGFSGDGGLATLASFDSPIGVTADNFRNVFVADQGQQRIKKIDKNGIIITVAGSSNYIGGFAYGGFFGDGGIADSAKFQTPQSVVTDKSGNIYIADAGNSRIRKICIAAQPATTKTADSSNTTTVFDVNNTIALHNGCDAIANLTPNGSNPVFGPISSQVWLDVTQNTGYVKRHYQITPSVNPTTSTATITLFFTQADFDDFNAVNAVKLPQNPTDAAGKANFKIEKRSGVSFDATGSPSSYNGTVVVIDPVDSNIVWNNTLSRWEVSFNVTGFSGFFVKTTATVLPVQWLLINGQLNNGQFAEINWQVQEQNVAKYEVQKSSDGINFQTIGTLNSVGNGLHNYHFTENLPLNGKAIYRIKQTDIDSRIDFSKAVYLGTDGKTMLYPNPAKATTTLFSSAQMLGSQAFLYNLQGKMLQQISIQQNAQTVDLSNLASGIYMLKLANGQTVKLLKE